MNRREEKDELTNLILQEIRPMSKEGKLKLLYMLQGANLLTEKKKRPWPKTA